MTLENRIQRLEDLEAIRALKMHYCALCDDGYPADALAELFTEDAVWDGGRLGKFVGREQIRGFFAGMPDVLSFAIHHVTNSDVEVDGDRARGDWYLLQVATAKQAEEALWLAGRYRDRYVRTSAGWRFARVRLEAHFMTSHREGWAREPFYSLRAR